MRWEETLETLKAHKGIYESEGKIWIASSQVGDEKDRVIVRENGEPTYLAGDIIYHQDKFNRPFGHYINIWGADHHGYIARVKAAIHFLGYDENKLEVLLSQMVSLLKDDEPYKMSKRAGNFILLKDVVDDIGADALRFIFLSKKPDTHLGFVLARLKSKILAIPFIISIMQMLESIRFLIKLVWIYKIYVCHRVLWSLMMMQSLFFLNLYTLHIS